MFLLKSKLQNLVWGAIVLSALSVQPVAAKLPEKGKGPIQALSTELKEIVEIGAIGVPAYAIINGDAIKGTYLDSVHFIGAAHDCGLVAGDILLMIDNKVTENPKKIGELALEYSGRRIPVRFARIKQIKVGNGVRETIEVHEQPGFWVIKTADGSTMESPGSDDVDSYKVAIKTKPVELSTSELEDFMFQMVNNARTMNGNLPKLKPSRTLSEMAKAYAEDMVKRKFFSHKDPDGKSMTERGTAFGINTPLQENLATQTGVNMEAREMVKRCQLLMMNEKADDPNNHRGHILDPLNQTVGIGVALTKNGVITVQEFSHEDLP